MTGRIRREPRWKRFTRLAHERLESRVLLVGDLLISELMPDNNSTLADEDGHYEDWIEIHNQGETRHTLSRTSQHAEGISMQVLPRHSD